jgi:hypothetical protein
MDVDWDMEVDMHPINAHYKVNVRSLDVIRTGSAIMRRPRLQVRYDHEGNPPGQPPHHYFASKVMRLVLDKLGAEELPFFMQDVDVDAKVITATVPSDLFMETWRQVQSGRIYDRARSAHAIYGLKKAIRPSTRAIKERLAHPDHPLIHRKRVQELGDDANEGYRRSERTARNKAREWMLERAPPESAFVPPVHGVTGVHLITPIQILLDHMNERRIAHGLAPANVVRYDQPNGIRFDVLQRRASGRVDADVARMLVLSDATILAPIIARPIGVRNRVSAMYTRYLDTIHAIAPGIPDDQAGARAALDPYDYNGSVDGSYSDNSPLAKINELQSYLLLMCMPPAIFGHLFADSMSSNNCADLYARFFHPGSPFGAASANRFA